MEVDRVVALADGGDVLVEEHRQVVLGGELVHRPQGAVVGAGR